MKKQRKKGEKDTVRTIESKETEERGKKISQSQS